MLLVEQPSLIFCKGTLACTATNLEPVVLLPQVKNLFSEFDDIFFKEGPIGLPPFRGIEHQIDLISGQACQIGPRIELTPRKRRR